MSKFTDDLKLLLVKYALALFLAVILVAVIWYHLHSNSKAEAFIKQLNGQLSEKERKIQELNTELGVAKSQLMPQKDLEKIYKSQLAAKDAEFEAFRKKHELEVASLTTAVFEWKQKASGKGHATVTYLPCPDDKVVDAGSMTTEAPKKPVIKYEWTEKYGRFHLLAENVLDDSKEPAFDINQQFKLNGVVLRQKNGNLATERVILEEVVADGKGGYLSLGQMKLVDAKFDYAPERGVKESIWDLSLFLEPGTTFQAEAPLNFGVGVSIVRVWKLTLGVDMLTDFKSWSGTGLGAQVIWRPKIGNRYFNVGLAAGAALTFGTNGGKVTPYVGIPFFIY